MRKRSEISRLVKKDRMISLFNIYTVITIAVYILPYLKFVLPYIPVALLMICPIFLFMKKRNKWLTYGAYLLCFSFVLMLLLLIKDKSFVNPLNELIRNIRFFLPALWGAYAVAFCSHKQKKVILVGFFVVCIFIFNRTWVALQENVWIARLLAESSSTSSNEINNFRLQNVGGFEFSYMIGIVTICLAWLSLNSKLLWTRVISIAATVMCYYYITQTMYATLLILTTICLVLLVVLYIKNPVLKIIFIVLSIGLLFFIAPISRWLSEVFNGSVLSSKFNQIYLSLTGGGSKSLGTRPELIKEAIIKFAENPIWGSKETGGNAHSLVFSILANYGLLGMASFVIPFIQSRNIIYIELHSRTKSTLLFDICMIYIFILAVLNPIGYAFELTIAAFFIVPVFIDEVTAENSNKSTRVTF